MKDTRGATDTLKGLAILVVLANHYLNLNVQGDSKGFANLAIAIFFMLSGYGIYYSLERLSKGGTLTFVLVLNFYLMRFVRIFPLYWTAYIAESVLHSDKISLLALLGVHCSGHYWFIAAIIQCYIFAPVIYIISRENRWLSINGLLMAFVVLNLIVSSEYVNQDIGKYLNFLHLGWRNLYFLYLFVFSMSMLLPQCIDSWNNVCLVEKKYYFFFIISMAILFMIADKNHSHFAYLYAILNHTFLPLILIVIGSLYLMANMIEIGGFSWLGKLSFSIYLFHMIMYRGIDSIFSFALNSILELIVFLLCFPLFFYLCKITDHANHKLATAIKIRLQDRKNTT